jgi:hypothetical protein
VALDPFRVTRYEIAEFGREAAATNIRYLGVCCGAGPHHIRALAETLGRRPPASRFSADVSKHFALGTDPSLKRENREFAKNLRLVGRALAGAPAGPAEASPHNRRIGQPECALIHGRRQYANTAHSRGERVQTDPARTYESGWT